MQRQDPLPQHHPRSVSTGVSLCTPQPWWEPGLPGAAGSGAAILQLRAGTGRSLRGTTRSPGLPVAQPAVPGAAVPLGPGNGHGEQGWHWGEEEGSPCAGDDSQARRIQGRRIRRQSGLKDRPGLVRPPQHGEELACSPTCMEERKGGQKKAALTKQLSMEQETRPGRVIFISRGGSWAGQAQAASPAPGSLLLAAADPRPPRRAGCSPRAPPGPARAGASPAGAQRCRLPLTMAGGRAGAGQAPPPSRGRRARLCHECLPGRKWRERQRDPPAPPARCPRADGSDASAAPPAAGGSRPARREPAAHLPPAPASCAPEQ